MMKSYKLLDFTNPFVSKEKKRSYVQRSMRITKLVSPLKPFKMIINHFH